MKTGKTLTELAIELDRQNKVKKDFIAGTSAISMFNDEVTNDTKLRVDGVDVLKVNDNAHAQIASRISIPQKYYDRMRQDAPELLVDNVNHWLHKNPERRMIRTLDGTARAFLSDRYRTLDNYELAQAVLPVLQEAQDIRIESAEITERRMYIKAIFPRIEGEIKKGDLVQSGVVISNSEIGQGSLRVEPLMYRLVCLNGLIANTSMKKYHVGRNANDMDAAYEVYQDETRKADDRAFWLKVQDIVRASLSDVQFKKIIEAAQAAAGMIMTASPVTVVERAAAHFSLTDGEAGGILTHLIQGGDLSAWGLANAFTRHSQDVPDYERATDFERLGGQIIELPRRDWEVLAAAA